VTGTELHFSAVDWELLIKRLLAYTHKMFMTAGLLRGEVLRPHGASPEDFVFEAMQQLLDPNDSRVAWASSRGRPTTEGLFRYLSKVIRNDFVDRRKARTQHAKTEGLVRRTRPGEGHEEDAVDPADVRNPSEDELLCKVNRERLLSVLLDRASGDRELEEYLLLQCCDGDYKGFTPQEAAEALGTTATNIQNRKRRCRRLFEDMAREQGVAVGTSRVEGGGSDDEA
jgi:DNA-directed RNA polymerase specialized sigma24 family protein